MERLSLMEMNEEGCIYAMDKGFIVEEYACRGGEDILYYTEDYTEAQKKLGMVVEEEGEEPLNLELHEGDDLFDLMCEYESLTWPRFKELMAEQGFELDMTTRKLIKK